MPFQSQFQAEPVTITGLINATFATAIAVAIGFFSWSPTDNQYTALAATQGLVILVLAFFTRRQVTPVE